MATSPLSPKTHYPTRSVSLPSRPHPLVLPLLDRLQASESAPLTSSTLGHKLSGLCDLYDCVEKLLLLPLNQQALSKESQEKWVVKLLEGSLSLLDVCGTAKDCLLQTREHVRELQSILRRRRGDEFALLSEIGDYSAYRKQVKKSIHKAVRNLKSLEYIKQRLNIDDQPGDIVSMLQDVETFGVKVFESLLSFIAAPKETSRSLIMRRLMQFKGLASDASEEISEFENLDSAMARVLSHKTSKSIKSHVENLHKGLVEMELSSQELEGGLECLYRHLVKTRVSLLNILNH